MTAERWLRSAQIVDEGQAPMNWQPIETAPKDGTAVWLWCDGAPYIGYFQPAEAEWDEPLGKWFIHAGFRRKAGNHRHDEIFGTYAHGVTPIGWQPLPAPHC